LLRTGRTVDIYFCFLLLGFCGWRRVYHRRVTFFFLPRWIVHSRFPFFTSGEQDQANEQIDISFHTSESNLRSDFAALRSDSIFLFIKRKRFVSCSRRKLLSRLSVGLLTRVLPVLANLIFHPPTPGLSESKESNQARRWDNSPNRGYTAT
jgi:hypothetical protein